jgi:hypothetical protein
MSIDEPSQAALPDADSDCVPREEEAVVGAIAESVAVIVDCDRSC